MGDAYSYIQGPLLALNVVQPIVILTCEMSRMLTTRLEDVRSKSSDEKLAPGIPQPISAKCVLPLVAARRPEYQIQVGKARAVKCCLRGRRDLDVREVLGGAR